MSERVIQCVSERVSQRVGHIVKKSVRDGELLS